MLVLHRFKDIRFFFLRWLNKARSHDLRSCSSESLFFCSVSIPSPSVTLCVWWHARRGKQLHSTDWLEMVSIERSCVKRHSRWKVQPGSKSWLKFFSDNDGSARKNAKTPVFCRKITATTVFFRKFPPINYHLYLRKITVDF